MPEAEPGGVLPRRRHRGIQWIGLGVGVAFLGGLIVALLATRTIQGSIPGSDTLLSLAVIHPGFLVGTAGGVFESSDGRVWLPASNIPREPVLTASDGVTAYVLAGGVLKSTTDLRAFTTVAAGVTGTVVAPGPLGVEVLAGRAIAAVGSSSSPAIPAPPPALAEPLAMAAVPGRPGSLLVGGVQGLWRTDDGGGHWQRILGTPSQAVLVDPANPQRILLGTPGGVLVSTDGGLAWTFTQLRRDVHGLSSENGKFFALTTERLVYGSNDGESGWTALSS